MYVDALRDPKSKSLTWALPPSHGWHKRYEIVCLSFSVVSLSPEEPCSYVQIHDGTNEQRGITLTNLPHAGRYVVQSAISHKAQHSTPRRGKQAACILDISVTPTYTLFKYSKAP